MGRVFARLGTRELSACGHDPTRLSPAAALHAFQRTLREYRVRPETPAETLWTQLRLTRVDDYQRRSAETSRSNDASPLASHSLHWPLITKSPRPLLCST